MLNGQAAILNIFLKSPWKRFTLREVLKLSKKTSYSYVYSTLKGFVAQGVLEDSAAGNVLLYSLVLDSAKNRGIYAHVSQHFSWKTGIPHKLIEKFTKLLGNSIYCLLVTGSYATGNQEKSSDLDMVLIAEKPQQLYAEVRLFTETSHPPIHLYIFTPKEFTEMLLHKDPNYGKEILHKHLLLYGGEIFYNCIKEAIKHDLQYILAQSPK